jgi:hypothetical protein
MEDLYKSIELASVSLRSLASSGMPTTRRLQARRLMLRTSRLPSAPWQGSMSRLRVWCSMPAALWRWVGCCGSGSCRMWCADRRQCGTRRRGSCASAFFAPSEEKQAGKLDYKRAFFAATDVMRRPAHLPLLEDSVSTAEQEEHSGSSRRGSVETCIFLMGLFLIWAVPALLILLKDYKCSSKHNPAYLRCTRRSTLPLYYTNPLRGIRIFGSGIRIFCRVRA